jgi:hypothetical protein
MRRLSRPGCRVGRGRLRALEHVPGLFQVGHEYFERMSFVPNEVSGAWVVYLDVLAATLMK